MSPCLAHPLELPYSLYRFLPGAVRSVDEDDHGPTVFDRLLFFNMFGNSSRSLFLGDSGRQSGQSKKEIHRGQSGPYRADWKKTTIIGEMPA